MIGAIATVLGLGTLPRIGPFLATCAGLAAALGLYRVLADPAAVLVVWGAALLAAFWAIPRAGRSGLPRETVVIDRFAGIWLAIAPSLPLAGLIGSEHALAAWASFALPLGLYSLLLDAPLRAMGRSDRLALRIGDDLVAGALAAFATLAAMLVFLHLLPDGGPS